MTVVSNPSPAKKPAHSSATYEAPTTSVFPGGFSSEKISSEVMTSSPPGIERGVGLPPTAITMRREVIWDFGMKQIKKPIVNVNNEHCYRFSSFVGHFESVGIQELSVFVSVFDFFVTQSDAISPI